MRVNKRIGRIVITCGTIFLLATPVMAGYGPADGTGNDGDGPKDGSGPGPGESGDCSAVTHQVDDLLLLVGNGKESGNRGSGENGGYGSGDGTGNGGDGPGDGSGSGPGDCTT